MQKRFLITGVSSGIGRELACKLITCGNNVWGVSRRGTQYISKIKFKPNSSFMLSRVDISKYSQIEKLLHEMTKKKFIPDVVILNAAIYENDFDKSIDINKIRRVHEVNFLANLNIINRFLEFMHYKGQFIVISSSSAFKGSRYEGIGYGTSKAAISLAFESLNQRYFNKKLVFTTIFLGPVLAPMRRLKSNSLFTVSIKSVVDIVIKSIEEKKKIYYHPFILFAALKILRLLPENIMFQLVKRIERALVKNEN